MKYILDANVFIEAKNRYYGFDFCPAFWHWQLHNSAIVGSIDKVKDEILDKEDELSEWVEDNIARFPFDPFDEASTVHFSTINNWIQAQNYTRAAIQKFQSEADYYVIPYAKSHGLVLVTHEVSKPDSKKKIKIPDVCNAIGVECVNTFDMLKGEKARFILDTLG